MARIPYKISTSSKYGVKDHLGLPERLRKLMVRAEIVKEKKEKELSGVTKQNILLRIKEMKERVKKNKDLILSRFNETKKEF